MEEQDGLEQFQDGPISAGDDTDPDAPPIIDRPDLEGRHLWAVRQDDVVHAKEACVFGKKLPTGKIKHTNLTGAAPAYAGGELLFIGDNLVVNGCSGRYGPRSEQEMKAVTSAFARSGYRVWSMGYDTETNRPHPFIGVEPQWVK